jgi:glycosyltransferase involved in cell wall biosynthesis
MMFDLSIVIPTLGRSVEVGLLLESIFETIQDRLKYEVIIVDQNFDNTLDQVVSKSKIANSIRHFKVNFRGLSRAKNFGISNSAGEFICFPDDDCLFLDKSIMLAIDLLKTKNYDIVCGRCVDELGNDSVMKFDRIESELNTSNLEGKFIEATMFAKRITLQNYLFDENLGIGKFHGAEEGFDLVYRMLKDKRNIFYQPDVKLYHPQVVVDKSSQASLMRVFTYRCGLARVCVKHGLYLKLIKRFIIVLAFLPICLMLYRNQFRYYIAELLGILSGIVVK